MSRKTLLTIAGLAILGALIFSLSKSSKDSDKTSSPASSAAKVTATISGPTKVGIHTLPKGSIAGRILDEEGSPLPGARVCARASAPELAEEDLHERNCVQAAANGAYQFPALVPARYSLSASLRAFLPAQFEFEDGDDTETSFKLSADETREGVDIVLKRGGVEVKGIVKDIGGGPIAGAWVAGSKGWSFGYRFGSGGRPDAVVMTKVDGSFSLWLEEGSISTSARAPGYAEGSASGIAPGQFIEILLTPESVLAGRVVEASTGKPVAGAEVSAGASDWFSGDGSARSDAEGNFRITRLPPGRFKPVATSRGVHGVAAESVLLGLGQTKEDIVIQVHPAFVVSGQVHAEGSDTPCEDAGVSLERTGGSHWGSMDKDTELVEFEAVLPGSYKVKVWCDGHIALDEYPEVEVSDADITGLKWMVRPGRKLVGRVVTSGGDPVPEAWVRAQMVGGDPRAGRSGGSAKSEDDGSFEIEGLRLGQYMLSAGADDFIRAEKPTKVVVAEDTAAEVELVVEDGGSLKGVVVDQDGDPVEGASIRARSLSGQRGAGGSTGAADDGSWVLKTLRPGRYRVTAGTGGWGGNALLGIGKGDDDLNGEEAEVVLGKTSEVRLVVQKHNGSISGLVVDENGKPVSDAFVASQRQSEAAGASKTRAREQIRWSWDAELELTDMDGRFTLDGLADGSYTLLAHRKGGGEAIIEDIAVGSETTLTIRSTGSLAGVATLPGGGFPSKFTVSVKDKESGFDREEEFYRTQGNWILRDLPAGNYAVTVVAKEGTAERKEILVAEGEDKAGIDLSLQGRGTLTGQLVSLETGDPVPGMRVMVGLKGGGGMSFSNSDKERVTDKEGRFKVADAPAGAVQIMAFPQDWGHSPYGRMRFSGRVEAGTNTDLGSLTIPERRVEMRERGGDLGFTLHDREAGVEAEDAPKKVALVRPDGPAAKSGLEAGDIILEVDGHDITGENYYLYGTLTRVKSGVTLTFKVERGETIKIKAAAPR